MKNSDYVFEVEHGEVTLLRYIGEKKEKIVIPETIDGYPVTKLGSKNSMGVFTSIEFIVEVVFPKTLKEVGVNAFNNCKNLVKTGLGGSNVTSIGNCAFAGCSELSDTELEESIVQNIGILAFSSSPLLEKTGLDGNKTITIDPQNFSGCSPKVMREFDDIVNKIQTNGEYNYKVIKNYFDTEIHLVKYIGEEKETIEIPEFIDGYPVTHLYNGTGIPNDFLRNGVFFNMKFLKRVKFPKTLKIIGDYAFCECSNLEKTGLKRSNVTIIERCAYFKCTSLITTDFKNSVVSKISKSAFAYCINLQRAEFKHSSVTTIEEYAFKDCVALRRAKLKNGACREIGCRYFKPHSFEGCSARVMEDVRDWKRKHQIDCHRVGS